MTLAQVVKIPMSTPRPEVDKKVAHYRSISSTVDVVINDASQEVWIRYVPLTRVELEARRKQEAQARISAKSGAFARTPMMSQQMLERVAAVRAQAETARPASELSVALPPPPPPAPPPEPREPEPAHEFNRILDV